ncbi:MAG TPA: LCP family protein [Clostridiaceae bacterium]|nr:LCP family protein [Clostridiaceae bacterium]
MVARRIIATICIFAILILFIDGLTIISFLDRQSYGNNSQLSLEGFPNNGEYGDIIQELLGFAIDNTDSPKPKNNNEINRNDVKIPERMKPFEQDYDNARNYQKNLNMKPVNLLILGLDQDKTRSDVIIVINYQPWKDTLNMISIPRDTKVIINGENHKINAMFGIGGEELTISKVEKITGLKIDYYVTIDLEAFRKIVDELGGVEIYVPFDMVYDDPEQNLHINLKKGLQVLNGSKAEQFVRYRKGNSPQTGYKDGDIGRINAQQIFIKALIEQKLNLKYIHKLDEIYDILSKHTRTNIKFKDLMYYLKDINNIKINKINNYILPGVAEIIDNLWYFIYDAEKTWDLINTSFYK